MPPTKKRKLDQKKVAAVQSSIAELNEDELKDIDIGYAENHPKGVVEVELNEEELKDIDIEYAKNHPFLAVKQIEKPEGDSELKEKPELKDGDCYPYSPIPYPIIPITRPPPLCDSDNDVDDMDMDDDQQEMDIEDELCGAYERAAFCLQPYFYRLRRPGAFYPSVDSQFKDGSQPDENLLLKQLFEAQPKHVLPSTPEFHKLLQLTAAKLVWKDSNKTHLWKIIRGDSFELFMSVIKAAASIVYNLHSKFSLLEIGSLPDTGKDIQGLWGDIAWMRLERPPLTDVLKNIARLMTDKVKFLFVRQPALDSLISHYCKKYSADRDWVPSHDTYPIHAFYPFSKLDKDGLVNQIIGAVTSNEYPPEKLKGVDHTRWLMRLLRGEYQEDEVKLVDEAMCLVALNKLDSKDILELEKRRTWDDSTSEHFNKILHIRWILKAMICCAKQRLKHQLMNVTFPLFALYKFASLTLPPEILEIVQVAELRRMGLGSRFIGRSHFLWAFYELGYGLPPKFRNQIMVHPDEDHPPYHIYLAALKLTKLLGEQATKLEHFVFSVIHSKDIGLGGEKVTDLVQNFRNLQDSTPC